MSASISAARSVTRTSRAVSSDSGRSIALFGDCSDAMSFAVADVQHPAIIDEHAVRPGQRTPPRIGLGSVAAPSRAQDRGHNAALQVDLADDVILGVGHIQEIAPAR